MNVTAVYRGRVVTEADIAFIQQLKLYYDSAAHTTQFFCMQSPLLGGTDQTNLNQALDLVVAHYAEAGDMTVHLLAVSKVPALGCTGHPNVAQHQALADALQAEIQSVMTFHCLPSHSWNLIMPEPS